MKRSTRWMIYIVFYISQLLGLMAFSYNYDTGKLKTKFLITFYSSIVSVIMFSSVYLLFRIQWKPLNANGPKLHLEITALMCLIRIIAVLITVLLNWAKRKEFMKTIEEFQRLRDNFLSKFVMSKKVDRYFEKSVKSKFYCGLMANIIIFLGSYDVLRLIFDIDSPLAMTGLGILATVLNIIMAHYFFALLNVNALLAVINEEVERILNVSSVLFKLQRLNKIKPGVLITTCCRLSDELDDLAMELYKLQLLGDRINKMYDLQGACVVLTLYMNNISVLYMTYMSIRHKEFSQEYGIVVIMVIIPISLFFHHMDVHVFLMNMLNFEDLVRNTASLLKNHQSWLPTLDGRFEKSLKDVALQLALFPLETKLLGLFQFNRAMLFATFGSTISNAIVLMQYDYKYSKN